MTERCWPTKTGWKIRSSPGRWGEKERLFAASQPSGHRVADLMSLIQPAKLNGHDPYTF
tara:strand:- start:819 stop:995 length:177 start_codon:yes stop_codon:yes gene_type:complete